MIAPEMKTPPADSNTPVTSKYTEAYNLNVRICVNAQMAQQNLYEVCKGLKEMRDGKLYKELGYSSFEDYCESEVGVSRFMAYKYVSVAEIKNVESIQQIGVTKLSLLAKLDEPQREEIQQNTDLESVSVRELKEKIKELEKDKVSAKERQDKLLKKNIELVEEINGCKKERDEANSAVQNLEKQLEEIESRPHDTYEDTTKIDELTAKLKEERDRHKAELENLKSNEAHEQDIEGMFRAYMGATVDSMKRLTDFMEKNSQCPQRFLFIEKLENIVMLTNQTIAKLKGEESCL